MIRSLIKQIIFQVPNAIELADLFVGEDFDDAAYLLSTLHSKLVTGPRHKRGWCFLRRSTLTRYMRGRHFSRIRSRLHELGIIELRRSYRAGHYSMAYRLNPAYWESKSVECQSMRLSNKIRAYHARQERRLLPVHRHLRAKLRLLEFDLEQAEQLISDMVPPPRSPLTVGEYHTLLLERSRRLTTEAKSSLTVDPFGRVHTPVTNLASKLRCCLTVGGQHLAGYDIANSQPLIAGIMAKTYYDRPQTRSRMKARKFDQRTTPYVRREIEAMSQRRTRNQAEAGDEEQPQAQPLSNMCCIESFEAAKTGIGLLRQVDLEGPLSDLDRYLQICQDGKLYEHFRDLGDRKQIKNGTFRLFFGRVGVPNNLASAFAAEFPSMANMLRDLKGGDYRHVAHLMQSYESTLVIAVICDRILRERPELPIYTIHDSILTIPTARAYVREVMEDEFGKIGIRPQLTPVEYSYPGDDS